MVDSSFSFSLILPGCCLVPVRLNQSFLYASASLVNHHSRSLVCITLGAVSYLLVMMPQECSHHDVVVVCNISQARRQQPSCMSFWGDEETLLPAGVVATTMCDERLLLSTIFFETPSRGQLSWCWTSCHDDSAFILLIMASVVLQVGTFYVDTGGSTRSSSLLFLAAFAQRMTR